MHRCARIGFDELPKLEDVRVECPAHDAFVVSPHLSHQLGAAHNRTPATQQRELCQVRVIALDRYPRLGPQRCTRLVHAALRVGIEKRTMLYYGAHAIIDVGHAEGWLAHVVRPQVAELPEARVGIAEGMLVRADASLDYFDWALGEMRRRA